MEDEIERTRTEAGKPVRRLLNFPWRQMMEYLPRMVVVKKRREEVAKF